MRALDVVDRDLILRKVAELERYLHDLSEYRTLDLDGYLQNWKTQRIVERTLHLAIEVCMDVADHIVADRGLPVPETASGAFIALGDAGMFDRELASSLARMVGFRNILVHDYARLDPQVVLRVLKTDLKDFERFRDAVVRLV
jgi:uncharacterized protein YutE (UPF0331/DUF86 family)